MNKDKVVELILQLTKKTIEGNIKWEAVQPPKGFNIGSEDLVPMLYVSMVKEKIISLYLKRYRHYTDVDEFYWSEKVCIAFLSDDLSRIIWEASEKGPSLITLFQTVTEQASGVDKLLNDFLNDEW